MEISQYGEFGLISHLTENFPIKQSSTVYGVGDDCAVIRPSAEDGQMLITTDLLLEGIHFDLTYCPLRHLGYKACVVNFSDIFAMMGTPRQLTVSIGVSKRFKVEDLDDFIDIAKETNPNIAIYANGCLKTSINLNNFIFLSLFS